MDKRILLGSMLVLVMLLLMPSIPALQQNSINEGFKQNFQEKPDSITLDDLKDFELYDGIKHPLLFIFAMSLRYILAIRVIILSIISSNYWQNFNHSRHCFPLHPWYYMGVDIQSKAWSVLLWLAFKTSVHFYWNGYPHPFSTSYKIVFKSSSISPADLAYITCFYSRFWITRLVLNVNTDTKRIKQLLLQVIRYPKQ